MGSFMMSVRAGQKEIVVLFTAFICVVYGFGIYLFPAVVESIRRDIDFSYGTMGGISASVQAGFLVSSALAGLLTLRFGAVNLILFSIIVCALALFGLVFVGSVLTLGALLLILGACASLIWVPMVEVSREVIPPRNRGKALGLMSSGTSYGVFVNSVLLAVVLPTYGWRMLWAVTGAGVAVLAIYSLIRLKHLRNGRNGRDPASQTSEVGIRARVVSLPRLLVGGILAMMFLNGFSCISFQAYLSAYLIGEVKLGEVRAASAWGLIGLVGMFSGFLMGALADRITIRRGMIVAYLVLSIAAVAAMSIAPNGTRMLLVHVASVAFGLSFYAIFGLVPAYISHLFSGGNAALVFAFGNVALGMGGVVGNLVGGYTRDFSGSFGIMYVLVLAAALASAVIAAMLPGEVGRAVGYSAPAV
ncbi:MAG: MFS transporter [Rhodobacter sp.]|nr:MFS transporter [Rhodobacter sp.]